MQPENPKLNPEDRLPDPHELEKNPGEGHLLPEDLREALEKELKGSENPREKVVDVMFALQDRLGYLDDGAVETTAALVGMTPLEVEELATFYSFIFREPVGKNVIHVCDSVICAMENGTRITDYLFEKLGIGMGETTSDGLFTLLPVCCIGFCDHAPALLINKKAYGDLSPEKLDAILEAYARNKD